MPLRCEALAVERLAEHLRQEGLARAGRSQKHDVRDLGQRRAGALATLDPGFLRPRSCDFSISACQPLPALAAMRSSHWGSNSYPRYSSMNSRRLMRAASASFTEFSVFVVWITYLTNGGHGNGGETADFT